jgi:sulfur carrier protein
MKIIVNGADHEARDGATLADVVTEVAGDRRDVAVARNGDVVRRADWAATTVTGGDRVEVLTAVQGG